MTQSYAHLWAELTHTLEDRQAARFLIEHVSGLPVSQWEQAATPAALATVNELASRRLAGEPLQYVLGRWAFRSLELHVDHRALIPRPETEELVELVLPFIGEGTRVLDLGTGTGAVALSIASECPGARVTATDFSGDALNLARENNERLHLDVDFREGSWFDALDPEERFDVIVSNPPYVEATVDLDRSVTEFEPHSALFAGPDGLDDLRIIVDGALTHLNDRGVLAMEMGITQTEAVIEQCLAVGFASAVAHQDMTGRPRFVLARSV